MLSAREDVSPHATLSRFDHPERANVVTRERNVDGTRGGVLLRVGFQARLVLELPHRRRLASVVELQHAPASRRAQKLVLPKAKPLPALARGALGHFPVRHVPRVRDLTRARELTAKLEYVECLLRFVACVERRGPLDCAFVGGVALAAERRADRALPGD